MDGKTSVKYLQEYIKAKDYKPELKKDYFLKLSEEAGELAKAMRKDVYTKTATILKEPSTKKYGTLFIMLWQSQTVMILMLKAQ